MRPFPSRRPTTTRARTRAIPILLVALLAAPLGFEAAEAETVVPVPSVLPVARELASVVWTGQHAYIFGGVYNEGQANFADILRFDPATGSVTTLSAKLPRAGGGTSAIWDGRHAYVFGGSSDEIVRFDPATESVSVVAKLPAARRGTSAVWDGQSAYIFGGFCVFSGCEGKLNEIVRFVPATNSVTVMNARLPDWVYGTAAAWDGRHAYVLGGMSDNGYVRRIVQYDPASDTARVMNTQLPSGLLWGAAAWNGRHVYFLGGPVYRYTPSSDTVLVTGGGLPSSYGAGAIAIGEDVWTFGGNAWRRSIPSISRVTYSLPSAPQGLTAAAGAAPGEVVLSWTPSAQDGGPGISAYRIYRGATSGAASFLAQVGAVSSYTDATCPLDTACYYTVRAVNSLGEGPASSEKSIAPPGPPRDLVAWIGPGVGDVTLAWKAPASHGGAAVVAYRIYRGTESGGGTHLATIGTDPTYRDSTCPLGQSCYYRVTAVNFRGEGGASNEASAMGTHVRLPLSS